MAIADLEAVVRDTWSREAIEIYADHLQAIGDPRGELVAIDLRIDAGDASDAVIARRTELIAQWFGANLPPGIVKYGFVDVNATGAGPDSQLVIALRGPGADYVRSVALAGPPDELERALDLMTAEPRPWLTGLSIIQWNETKTETTSGERIVTMLPELHTVAVAGRRVFGDLVHPSVRSLRVSGFDAFASLRGSGAPWPELEALDFAFHCHLASEHRDPPKRILDQLLPAARLPALRMLDLSRNEPGRHDPNTLGGQVDVGAFVERMAAEHPAAVVQLPAHVRR